jgi:hypothetical protein
MSGLAVFFNTIGVIGAALLLFGFYRINSGSWSNKSFWYEMDNCIGALFVIIYQIHYHAYVTVVVNMVWGLVAVIGLALFFKRLRTHRKRRRA